MHNYKVPMPNGKALEFKSQYHLSTISPNVAYGNYFLYFEDAEVTLNLINLKEIEIDGQKHKVQL